MEFLGMPTLTVLGTAGAVSDGRRDNVSFVVTCNSFHVLCECGGSAAHKLAKVGTPYEALEDVIITHTHVDHFYGLPALIFSMRYRDQQRMAPLNIYCPEPSIADIQTVLEAFGLLDGKFFPLLFHGIPLQERALVLENERVIITATPVAHAPDVPTCGIKIHERISGKTIVYSSDTGPSENLIRLAQGADLLFHECAGLSKHPIPPLHSNAAQVGHIARQAGVKRLVLLHLDMVCNDAPEAIIAEVWQEFPGDVSVASDFDEYEL
jgi:ribonuclease Z